MNLKINSKTNKVLVILLVWGLLAVITIVFWRWGAHQSTFLAFGLFGLFILSLVSSATLVIPGPSLVGVLVAGSQYNPLLVGLVMGLGAGLGEITGYLAGLSGQHLIPETRITSLISKWMARRGTLTIFLLAAVPNIFTDIGGILAGITRFPVSRFLVACIAGKLIRFSFAAYLGYLGFRILGLSVS